MTFSTGERRVGKLFDPGFYEKDKATSSQADQNDGQI
jgi:hypothetical protein